MLYRAMTMPSRILLSRSHIFRLWRSVGWPYHIIRKSMISDCGCLEFAKLFLIKKGRVNISLVSVPMVRALVHSLSLASAIRNARGGDPFFIREREYGMDRYARFGPTDREKMSNYSSDWFLLSPLLLLRWTRLLRKVHFNNTVKDFSIH